MSKKNFYANYKSKSDMSPELLIDKYYPEENKLKHILLIHSQSVLQIKHCR